ncbi:unnamed protein product [Schistocephalus solidus]|uniref:Reticulon-like protein n=1 Tax=Schistocephalus solidus TaxID=70667 RepID=A0A183SSY0_SCHSO|nr:unnamed protein product [Schistocephalus solidus]
MISAAPKLKLWSAWVVQNASLNDVRLRLLTGKQPSQQNHKLRGGTADADPGTAFPAMFVSHLDSLNYHLVNWCERIRVLREKALSKAPSPNPSSLWSLVSEDLQLMRYILKNCETCLNEAESVTTAKPPEENSALTETRPPSAETNRETAPIKIEAVDLPTEDEVLEAVADPDSTSPSDGDLGIYDNDIFTGRLDLKTVPWKFIILGSFLLYSARANMPVFNVVSAFSLETVFAA